MIIDSFAWTGRRDWRRERLFLPVDDWENTLRYKPKPPLVDRLFMRAAEVLLSGTAVARQYEAERLNWMRPYMRTGATWWRPLFGGSDAFEVYAPEQDLWFRRRFVDRDAMWWDLNLYIAVVMADYEARRKFKWLRKALASI